MEGKDTFLDGAGEEWKEILKSVEKAEKQWNAPFYLFDETRITLNIDQLRGYFGTDTAIAYAIKANPWLVSAAAKRADYIEVCTSGELELCQAYNIPAGKIVLDGVFRTEEMLKRAFSMGVKRFCIDSAAQAQQMISLWNGTDELELLLRLSSGNRFGMDKCEVERCMEICRSGMAVRIVGIQYYPGTQRSEVCKVRHDLKCLEQWMDYLESVPGINITEVQFGGGIGFPYFTGDNREGYAATVDVLAKFVNRLKKRFRVIYEAGRCVAASAGIYVTKVFQIKERESRKIIFCLGGTNHLQYPGGVLGIRSPRIEAVCEEPSGDKEECMICGSLCSEADVMVRSSMLDAEIRIGDLIVFYGAGAYGASESPNLFLAMEMPAILVYNKMNNLQKIRCVRGHTSTYRLFDDGV